MLVPGDEPIPGYRLQKFLGQGQFGQVWKSTSPGGTSAALKILDLGGKQGWKEFEAIQHVKRLVHPHLMPITSLWLVDESGNVISDDLIDSLSTSRSGVAETIRPDSTLDKVTPRWLIVANLLGDKSLQDVLSEYQDQGEQGVPVAELLSYMTEAAKGIDYLNSSVHLGDQKASVQHCDIKPANMLLVGGSVMICDFGVAKILNDGISATATGMIGSMAYMSPECVDRKPSAASDQYSLAVSYYQLRTGKLPFVDESVATVLASHQSGKLDFSSVGPAEAAVLRKATSPLPQNRYTTAQAMVDALRQAVSPIASQKKASPWRWIVPILATAGIVAGIFFALNDRSSPPTPDSPSKYVIQFSGSPTQVRIDGKEVAVGPDGRLEVSDVTDSEFLVEILETEQYEPLRQTLNVSEFAGGPIQISLKQKPAFLVSRAHDLLTNGDFENAVIQYAEAIRLAPDQYARAPAPVQMQSPNSQRLTTLVRSNFADLIVGDEAGRVFLWQWSDSPHDAKTKELHSNRDAIDSLAIGSDLVASVGLSGRILVSSQKQSSTTPIELQVAGDTPARIAISRDDHWLISSSKSTESDHEMLQIWDLQDSDRTGRMLGNVDGMVRCLSFSADANWFAVGTTSGWLKVDSTATLQLDNQPSQTLLESVEVLAIASDSSYVAYAGEDDMQGKTNSAWFVPIGSPTATKLSCMHRDVIEAIAISPDNTLVATGGAHDDASVQICSPGRDRPPITIPAGHDSSILSLVFDNSNDWIISASPNAVFLNQISRPDAPLQIGPTSQVKQVRLSANGEWIVVLDSSGQVQIWNLLECKMIQQACREAGVLRMRVRPVPRDIPNEI